MNIKEPMGRLAQWALLLQQYNCKIVHRAGKSNCNADTLSRRDYHSVIAAVDTSGDSQNQGPSMQGPCAVRHHGLSQIRNARK